MAQPYRSENTGASANRCLAERRGRQKETTSAREPTEAVREAAWEIADILDCGPLSWAAICCETEVSDSTMRRASRLLRLAGVICYDRVTDRWSRVGDVEIPAELLPRLALVLELKAARANAKIDTGLVGGAS